MNPLPPRRTARTALHRALRALAPWLAVPLLLYAALLALVAWRQEALLFHPQLLAPGHRFDVPPDVHETWVEVPGARLHALHLRLPQPRGVVFFLHGNAGSLQNWFVDTGFYRQQNLDLYMLDYRGFGKSSGRIENEAQLRADVRAAWAAVAARYEGRARIVIGRSLGSGLAAMLAAEVQPELTVLVSPYSSLLALAGELYPWVPGPLLPQLLRYPLRTDQALPQVQGRVLLVHGQRDTLIPPVHSQRLQRLQPSAELLWLPEAGHNDLQAHPAYREGLARAFGQALADTPAR